MLPSSTHLMPVIGLDLHLTTSGNPFHPYIGMVIDPFDYIPFLGSNVNINGLKRGVSDTSGVLITFQHIPLVGVFIMMPIIGHESMNFFSSQTVFAEGTRLSPKGYMLMTCNDVGIPLSGAVSRVGKKKFKFTPTLFAPTSYSIPIPTGAPVMVGGPYAPDWGGALTGLLASIGFSTLLSFAPAILKAIKKAGKKGLTAFNHKVLKKGFCKKMKATRSLSKKLCKHGFEPVNLVNGVVVYEGEDFFFPGMLPFSWERVWYSDSDYTGWLGHGVHSAYDRSITFLPEDDLLVLRLSDGRLTSFPVIGEGEDSYNRLERITLSRTKEGYIAFEHSSNLSFHFTIPGKDRGYSLHRLSSIVDLDNRSVRLSYENGVLAMITDSCGRQITVRHTDEGFIESLHLKMPDGNSDQLVRYSYDEQGDMVGITDALGQTTSIRYEEHRMVEKTDRNGYTFFWEYDKEGSCVHTRGEDGDQEGWISYFPEQGYNTVRDACGAESTYRYDANQLVRSITDALGNTTRYDYTEEMEPYREIDPEGRIIGWHYDERGNQIGTTYPDGTLSMRVFDEQDRMILQMSPKGNRQIYVYDSEYSHRVRTIIEEDDTQTNLRYTPEGNLSTMEKGGRKITMSYDDMGNLICCHSADQELKRWEYDYRGRLLMEQTPLTRPLQYEYDQLDRVRRVYRPDGNIVDISYDCYENVTEVKDKDRHVKMSYTPMGSLKSREEHGKSVEFFYDAMERLTTLRNERGSLYRFKRDKAGNIIREIGFDDIERRFTLNGAGDIIRVDRPDGRYTTYEHNAFGRISNARYSDGTWESFSYDKDGQLCRAANLQGEVIFSRDKKGRIIKEEQILPNGGKKDRVTIEHEYDQWGGHIGSRSSLGAEQKTTYTPLGETETLHARHSEQLEAWESRIRYDEGGREIERFATGDVRISSEYDFAGRLEGRCTYAGKEKRGYRFYAWKRNDRLLSMRSHLRSAPVMYDYDHFGTLIGAALDRSEYLFKTPDIIGNIYRDRDAKERQYDRGGKLLKDEKFYYRYDGEGNLILKSTRNVLVPPVMPQPKDWLDKLLSRTTPNDKELQVHYSWQEGDTAYEWYGNGMLKSVITPEGTTIKFEYDALGRRTLKETHDTSHRYAWDGNVLLHEWNYDKWDKPRIEKDSLGRIHYDRQEPYTNLITWVYDGGSYTPVAKLTEEDSYTIVQDYLGTPIQVLDSKGNVVWDCILDIYGDVLELRGEKCFIPFRFQGQYEDEETGLYNNRFRYYDPKTGNYISQDPIRLAGNNPTIYGYVSDANSWIDTFGLDCSMNVKNSGHHVPAVRKSIGRSFEVERTDKTRPTFHFKGDNPSFDHWRLHNAERSFVGPRQGSFIGTNDELFDAYKKAYEGLDDILIDVKSPNGTYVLGENVTPSQGVTLVQDWLKAQGLY